MNKEEIEYALEQFSKNRYAYMFENGLIISFYDVLRQLKQLQQENQKYKEVIDKAIKYINNNLIISSILDGKKYYTINNYSFDCRELLDILKEVE